MTWALRVAFGVQKRLILIGPWCIASSIFQAKRMKRVQSKGCRETVFRRLDRC